MPTVRVIDGIDLWRFKPGQQYDLGATVAALFLAEGWAEPVSDDEPHQIEPFSDEDPYLTRVTGRGSPTSLVRETYSLFVNERHVASDFKRRRRPRRSSG